MPAAGSSSGSKSVPAEAPAPAPAASAPGSNWAQLKKQLANAPSTSSSSSTGLTSKQAKSKRRKEFMAAEADAGVGAGAEAARASQKSSAGRDGAPARQAGGGLGWSRGAGPAGVARYLSQTQTQSQTQSQSQSQAQKNGESSSSSSLGGLVSVPVPDPVRKREAVKLLPIPEDAKDARAVQELRAMVLGETVLNEGQKAIALDCEMVGLGPLGAESALARISVVNYHGHVLLDTHVQPREAVTDYRTWISGVRASDLVGAPTFEDVQRQVAGLVEGRVVVGHALDNDFKALLLSHPAPLVRDTQTSAPLRLRAKSKRPGLAKLAALELGLEIQKGAHSSVVDARATMALYRLHKAEWERGMRGVMGAWRDKNGEGALKGNGKGRGKRGREEDGEEGEGGDGVGDGDGDGLGDSRAGKKRKGPKTAAQGQDPEPESFPGGGRRGISSNVGLVITHRDGTREVRRGKRGYVDQGRKGGASAGGAGGGGGNWWEDAAG